MRDVVVVSQIQVPSTNNPTHQELIKYIELSLGQF